MKLIENQKLFLIDELKKNLFECKKFYFNVAFMSFSGVQLLLESLHQSRGKILTSSYLGFTDVKSLEVVNDITGIELKIFITKTQGFHSKGYIFEYENYYKIIIGSSNLTSSALKSNIEWNVEIIEKKDSVFLGEVLDSFDSLFTQANDITPEFLGSYREYIKSLIQKPFEFVSKKIIPNNMQIKALNNLKELRTENKTKALLIAATGSGKTYLSAFDVKAFAPKKFLFLVHNKSILTQAKRAYEKVINEEMGLYTGESKSNAPYLFATIQSMKKFYSSFARDYFEYIVVDEAHRSVTQSYDEVLNYFKPQFLLGMSATPYTKIYARYDNICLNVGLKEALKRNFVSPFHYYGISDDTDVSGSIKELSSKLSVHKRVDFIIKKMQFFGYDGDARKALGFCVDISHAKYMSDQFNSMGIASAYLSGEDSIHKRESYIKRLENAELEVLFVVDIFNEGVDIPCINTVLFLRPTESMVVFAQQLGRGLRKAKGKEFVTVLDFIANYDRSFMIVLALNSGLIGSKKALIKEYKNNFYGCHISMDRVAEELILKKLESTNLNTKKYLLQEYKELNLFNKTLSIGDISNMGFDNTVYRIIKVYGSYYHFLSLTQDIKYSEDFLDFAKQISRLLPIKREDEFVVLKNLINKNIEDGYIYAKEFLSGKYKDSRQKLTVLNSNFGFSKEFKSVVKSYKKEILELLDFGLSKYEEIKDDRKIGDFYTNKYYTLFDVSLIAKYKKTLSSFRGRGLIHYEGIYYLFVNLNDNSKYENTLIDNTLRWHIKEKISSNIVKNIINSNKRIYLFARREKKVDGIIMEYKFYGELRYVNHIQNELISFDLKII
ncbi:MAG: Helicase conserved C-terminal domain-containing protein [uncultured Campylobacterales bacterium]|uniref:Helicase conserved C-terminal domain-containing protein n=1 Tax=uncultured Campylobacterales bacterium TaxID=352960 RepID=A0A6S6T430_9BACT|nr:MAG: Helicase conserved C-terminal domain-containing protein [uncultured Campylobacterales bacterium]